MKLKLTLIWRTPFPFLQLLAEVQLRILELVLHEGFSQQRGPHIYLVPYSGEFHLVIRLDLPTEGILQPSREMRTLSLHALYQSPQMPPVYASRCSQPDRPTRPFTSMPASTITDSHCLRRARHWRQAMIPRQTCWMGADGQFRALAGTLSETQHLQRL